MLRHSILPSTRKSLKLGIYLAIYLSVCLFFLGHVYYIYNLLVVGPPNLKYHCTVLFVVLNNPMRVCLVAKTIA